MYENSIKLWAAIIFILFTAGAIFISCASHGTRETLMIMINDKERIATGSGDYISHKYLVYSDVETFEITDSLIEGRFDSSDMYGHLREGRCYQIDVYGWRIPMTSSYRNIVDAQEVDCERITK